MARFVRSIDPWLAVAILTAITCTAVVHWAIFAAFLAGRLICSKSNRAKHRGENHKQRSRVLFHTRFNVRTKLKLRQRFGDCENRSHRKRLQISQALQSEMRSGTEPLKDKGNKAFHTALIRRVLTGKFLQHEFFLVTQFDPNAHEHQRHPNDSSHVPEHNHRCS